MSAEHVYLRSGQKISLQCLYFRFFIFISNRVLHENCALLGYNVASGSNFLPTFWDNLSVPSSGYPENGTDRLSRNVGKELPLLVAE
jgi:hypothetical protein